MLPDTIGTGRHAKMDRAGQCQAPVGHCRHRAGGRPRFSGTGRRRRNRREGSDADTFPGAGRRSGPRVSRYPPRMRPTTRDFAGIAIFVLVLLVLLVAFVAAAIPPAHP